jgi:hypothetical protein
MIDFLASRPHPNFIMWIAALIITLPFWWCGYGGRWIVWNYYDGDYDDPGPFSGKRRLMKRLMSLIFPFVYLYILFMFLTEEKEDSDGWGF